MATKELYKEDWGNASTALEYWTDADGCLIISGVLNWDATYDTYGKALDACGFG